MDRAQVSAPRPLSLVGCLCFWRFLPLHQFNVEAERLQLANEHVERFGHARLDTRLALDDGLVDLRAAVNVVGLCREQLLQDVRRTVRFQRPDFHFTEALAAELRLTTERLLGDERVGPDRASVNLVVDQVRQLEHVDVADSDWLIELVAGHTVEEVDLAGVRQARDFEQVADFRFARAIENRRGEWNSFAEPFGVFEQLIVRQLAERLPDGGVGKDFLEPTANGFSANFLAEQALQAVAEFLASPAEVRFKNLSDVHTRRIAELLENDLDPSAIRHIRHVFLRHDASDNAFVTVASGHLVADGELALHRDIDLDELDDTRRQFVALLQFFLALFGDLAEHVDLARSHFLDLFDLLDEQRILFVEFQTLEVTRRNLLDDVAGQFDALGEKALVGLFVVQIGLENFPAEQIREALEALIREDADFIGKVFLELEDLIGFDGLVALVFFAAHADDTALIEIAKERFADVGDVARDFFGSQLRVARFDFVLLDVDRGVVVVLDQLIAHENGVFEVVPAPWNEGDEYVASESEFAAFGARTVREDLSLLHAVAYANQRLLVDASVLVGTLEFDELIDVSADFTAEHAGVIGLDANDDAFGVDLIDDAIALAEHDRARIASGDALHAGTDERSISANQRNGLALHVRTHQRAVGVVVLEERNQAGGDGDELLWRNVDVVDFIAALQHEVAGLTAVDEFRGDLQTLIERDVGLRDDVLIFFPSGQVEAVRLGGDLAALELFVELFDAIFLDDFAGFEFAIAGVDDLNVVDDAATLDLAVRRLDEAVVVDARKARQRADQTDVRTFRRFDWADAAVVGRVNVADFKSSAFARQTARSKSRKTPLVRNFAQGIGLVHELTELR